MDVRLLWFVCACALTALAIDHEDVSFAISVPARRMECFFFEVLPGEEVTFDYSVVVGGNLDINAYIRYPGEQRNAYYESRVREGSHRVNSKHKPQHLQNAPRADWAYEFCLDNGFSTTTPKIVEVDVWYNSFDGSKQKLDDVASLDKANQERQLIGSGHMVSNHLKGSYRVLTYFRHVYTKHRAMAEANYERVNWYSMLFVGLLIIVPVIQIIMIKRMLGNATGRGGARISGGISF